MSTAIVIAPDRLRIIEQEITERIRRSAMDIYEIGIRLQEVKDGLEHGEFLDWLDAHFSWSESTAENLMKVARRFDQQFLIDNPMPSTVLYMLASESTPESSIGAAVDAFQSGVQLTREQTQKIITAGKFVDKKAPDSIKSRVAAGEISLIDAADVTQKIQDAPEPVAQVAIRYAIDDPDVIVALAKVLEALPDLFSEIAATGYLQGSADPIAICDANARDIRAALGEARFEHHLETDAAKNIKLLDCIFIITEFDPENPLQFSVRVDTTSSEIREGLTGRMILKPATRKQD